MLIRLKMVRMSHFLGGKEIYSTLEMNGFLELLDNALMEVK